MTESRIGPGCWPQALDLAASSPMLHRLVVLNSELSPGVGRTDRCGPDDGGAYSRVERVGRIRLLSFNKAGFGVDERDHSNRRIEPRGTRYVAPRWNRLAATRGGTQRMQRIRTPRDTTAARRSAPFAFALATVLVALAGCGGTTPDKTTSGDTVPTHEAATAPTTRAIGSHTPRTPPTCRRH